MKRSGRSPVVWAVAMAGLALLPLSPEACFYFNGQAGLKFLAPILYYEALGSFFLLAPSLVLPRALSRLWIFAMGTAMGLATLIIGFYAAAFGARWNLTAHAAMMQTYRHQVADFLWNFTSPSILTALALLAAGFGVCVAAAVRSERPRLRVRLVTLLAGFAASAFGVSNAIRFGGQIFKDVPIVGGAGAVRVLDVSINRYNPVLMLAMTHYNYLHSHAYYSRAFRDSAEQGKLLAGAVPAPGAVCPRIVVVVVGESACRRHLSLYGYARDTDPRLAPLAPELHVFDDVICTTVGTLASFRAMFATTEEAMPAFPLFSAAGYRTHWLSTHFDQGGGDLEIAALVGTCDETAFLNGAYDENLLPLAARAIASPGRHMVFINLFGSHVRYQDRYPAPYDVFKGHSYDDHLLASYDNTIRYSDAVLADLIGLLRQRQESSCLLYVSDHGEDVFDSRKDKYLFRSESLATPPMYEIPFFVWFSQQYIQDNPRFVKTVAAATSRGYQTRALYQCLLDLARLRHPIYDPQASLFSEEYVERERKIGDPPRVYRKD